MNDALPIHAAADDIAAMLRTHRRVVLSAPTGTGKTTQIPQMLLHGGQCDHGQILVLEPRRLAARMVAARVAEEMGTVVGDLVGYQTRHESRVSGQTRIRFMTEGLFLRMLQQHRGLPGVAAVVLDEFHERSLDADLALALVRQLQHGPQRELHLLVMSATLEVASLGRYLEVEPIEVHARQFPVDVRYHSAPSGKPVWEQAADALDALLGSGAKGDVLVFMPGVFEIRRTIAVCGRVTGRHDCTELLPLHGQMSPAEQDRVMQPTDRRRVIVATNVAQTSITIPGVRHVIDSGLARIHRYDSERGISVLAVEPVSVAAADQRAGRAGRTGPGAVYRLWTQRQQHARADHDEPEIRRVDLAEAVLRLHATGLGDARSIPWLDAPDSARLDQAEDLLERLGAIVNGTLTATGRAMAQLPTAPRPARLLVEAARRGVAERAALWVAIISERDFIEAGRLAEFARPAAQDQSGVSDLAVLETAFRTVAESRFAVAECRRFGVHAIAARELELARRQTLRVMQQSGMLSRGTASPPGGTTAELIQCLLPAYGDQLASLRESGDRGYIMLGGQTAALEPSSVARGSQLVLAIEVAQLTDGASRRRVLRLASRVEPDWLLGAFVDRMTDRSETLWDPDARAVMRVDQLLLDDLVIDQSRREETDSGKAAAVLADRIIAGDIRLSQWDESVEQWIVRVRCVARWFPQRGLLRYTESDLRQGYMAICAGATRARHVQDKPVLDVVRGLLCWEDVQFVEKMAPSRIDLPRGRGMKLRYQEQGAPIGRAKVQELYDLHDTPRVAGGQVKVLLEILAPNYRPVQITDDLAGFWERTYPEVKKELRRRYAKHEWR